jgi:hypothetical protein
MLVAIFGLVGVLVLATDLVRVPIPVSRFIVKHEVADS